MIRSTTAALGIIAMAVAASAAAPSIELLPSGFLVSGVSRNGSAMSGNMIADGSYETFRWTAATGVVRLGRASVPAIGQGAGTPDISFDGTRVSASILSSDNRLTQGLWTLGSGWVETMPPLPPGAANIDETYGSAWGLSGDGLTVTGFYWSFNARAQASTWSQTAGMVHLPQTSNQSARVNASNYDASVVVGWEERPDGNWRPTAWRNSVKITLSDQDILCEAHGVNAGGDVIAGESEDPAIATRVATLYRWNGAAYVATRYGILPGTAQLLGSSEFFSVSADGQIAVGANQYSSNPAGGEAGIIWTPSTGLMSDVDYLASIGLAPPDGMNILEFTNVSADGHTIVGYGLVHNAEYHTFIIHLPVTNPADLNVDGSVGAADLALLLGSWGVCGASCPADIDGDNIVGAADLAAMLGSWS